MMELLLILICGYLSGCISFGMVACYLFCLGDIRDIGSGNIGATNVLRTGNKWAALFTFIGDSGKGLFFLLILHYITDDMLSLAVGGVAAIIGHNFPFWLKFKGGKGIATSIGVMAVWSPILALVYGGAWLSIALVSRISSLAGLGAFIAVTIYAYFYESSVIFYMVALIAIIAFMRHRDNIKRILKGEEKRINFNKNKA